MNRLNFEEQCQIAALLVDSNSIRGAARILGRTPNTISRNLLWIGEACQRFHHETARGLRCSRVQADEVWTFIQGKPENLPESAAERNDLGEIWSWSAIDPDSKFTISWHVGNHTAADAATFLDDLARRIPGHIQLTTDQLMHYRSAVENAFGNRVDYATISKIMHEPTRSPDLKYQPVRLRENRIASVYGQPDPDHITTTDIESSNTRLRLWNRRFTRSTVTISRSLRNLRASVALHYTFANWCRIPKSTRCTPAMEIGLTDHIWEIQELLEKVNVEQGREVGYLNRRTS